MMKPMKVVDIAGRIALGTTIVAGFVVAVVLGYLFSEVDPDKSRHWE
jgi:hypothetical protein